MCFVFLIDSKRNRMHQTRIKTFQSIVAIIRDIDPLQSHFFLLYLPTLAIAYTARVRCTDMLFM
jgi:hypothetical protein